MHLFLLLRRCIGALAMPRWPSASSLGSSSTSSQSHPSSLEPSLLTTCVGSLQELQDLVAKLARSARCPLPLASKALHVLFYYMRCSQVCNNYSPVLFLNCCHIVIHLYAPVVRAR